MIRKAIFSIFYLFLRKIINLLCRAQWQSTAAMQSIYLNREERRRLGDAGIGNIVY